MVRWCLSSALIPSSIWRVNQLPVNGRGKIDRSLYVSLLAEQDE